jgi:hypothetical protein
MRWCHVVYMNQVRVCEFQDATPIASTGPGTGTWYYRGAKALKQRHDFTVLYCTTSADSRVTNRVLASSTTGS